MKIPVIYITRTDWETKAKEWKELYELVNLEKQKWRSRFLQKLVDDYKLNNAKDFLPEIYKGDKYYQDDADNWRNKLGQYASPREVMAEQLRIERNHKQACDAYEKPVQWDELKKAGK